MSERRIIITGAASGIGAATMASLRRSGAQVVGLDRDTTSGEIVACDVRDQASVDEAIAAATRQLGGGVDVLINCAGLATPQSAGEPPDARALAVIDVNLLGPWRVTGACVKALRASRGRVVNVASGMAYVAMPFAPAYAMSKHGIVAYSQALRLEHGDAISVTTVYPGYTETPIHRDSIDFGLTLAGSSPEEKLSDVVAAMVRAATADPAPRDIVTTRTGRATVALTRFAPRSFTERTILRTVARTIRGRSFDGAPEPLRNFADRVARPGRRAQ